MFYWQGPCVYGVKLLALFVALKSQGQGWILVQVINMYWKLFSSLLRILTALKATEVLRKVRALSHVLSLAQRCLVLDFLPWFTGPGSSHSVCVFFSPSLLFGCRVVETLIPLPWQGAEKKNNIQFEQQTVCARKIF